MRLEAPRFFWMPTHFICFFKGFCHFNTYTFPPILTFCIFKRIIAELKFESVILITNYSNNFEIGLNWLVMLHLPESFYGKVRNKKKKKKKDQKKKTKKKTLGSLICLALLEVPGCSRESGPMWPQCRPPAQPPPVGGGEQQEAAAAGPCYLLTLQAELSWGPEQTQPTSLYWELCGNGEGWLEKPSSASQCLCC